MKQHIDIIQDLYAAFAEGNIKVVLGLFDPNIEWREAEGNPYADRNPYIGPQAILEGLFMRLGAEWEYWNNTAIELIEAKTGEVVSTGRYRAKHKGTGKELNAQFVHKFWFKDGKIVKFQQYTDTLQHVEVMGV